MPAKTPGPTTATRSNAQITELIDLLETMQNKAKGLKNFLLGVVLFADKKANGIAIKVPIVVPIVAIFKVSQIGFIKVKK